MAKKKESLSFERSLDELENIVQKMEQGDLTLEESLASFERGISLTRECQLALKEAEQKVNMLVQQSGQTQIQPFSNMTDNSEK